MTERTCEELAALWEAVFGETLPITTDPGLIAEVLVRCLPTAEPYAPQVLGMAKLWPRAS